jgi:uncharacterized protein (DUF952 family)
MDLHHVVTAAEWAAAQREGRHAPASLDLDGFLHCCTPAQLGFVLRRHFAGATGLVVLTFDADSVPAELRWVRSEPDQDPFPHLYGAIPAAAVRSAAPLG